MNKPISEIIGEAIGEASLCWEPKPHGVFDSRYAEGIRERLILEVQKAILEAEARGIQKASELVKDIFDKHRLARKVDA